MGLLKSKHCMYAQADDVRAAVRVPFTRIIPTALSVIDTTNDSSSGAG